MYNLPNPCSLAAKTSWMLMLLWQAFGLEHRLDIWLLFSSSYSSDSSNGVSLSDKWRCQSAPLLSQSSSILYGKKGYLTCVLHLLTSVRSKFRRCVSQALVHQQKLLSSIYMRNVSNHETLVTSAVVVELLADFACLCGWLPLQRLLWTILCNTSVTIRLWPRVTSMLQHAYACKHTGLGMSQMTTSVWT